jgi:hypothetical protein
MNERAVDAKRESKTVDFKRSLSPDAPGDWCELIKDIVAMANSGGGTILIGVDNDGSSAGDSNVQQVLSVDPAHVTDKIQKYTGVHFDNFSISEGSRAGSPIAVLGVGRPVSPLVFDKPGTYALPDGKQKTAFSAGTVYIRHGAKSEPATTEDLRRILERYVQFVRKEWMSGVRKVVNAPIGSAVNVLPAEVRSSESQEATPIRITKDASAPAYRLVDPDVTHPWRQKELIKEVNKSLPNGQRINQFDIQAIRHLYDLDSDHRFRHKSRFAAPQYSPEFYKWLLEQVERDPAFFEKSRQEFKRRRSNR